MIRFNYIRQVDKKPMAHVRVTFSLGISELEYAGLIWIRDRYAEQNYEGNPFPLIDKLTASDVEEVVRTELLLNGTSEWSPTDFDIFKPQDAKRIEAAIRDRVRSLYPNGVKS